MTEPQINDLNTDAVVRGREIEPVARKAATAATGIEFEEIGMMFSDDMPEFGLSPDAVYMEDGVVVGGIELKCPNSKKHVQYIIDGVVPKEYIAQVRAPFLIDEAVKWWYFASFDDRNYERPLLLVKVERGDIEGHIDNDHEKLRAFLSTVNNAHAQLTF